MLADPAAIPIGARAWIGDGRRGASVGPDGTLDWFASGGIDAPPDLWRLLDPAGPALRVGPAGDTGGTRRHRPEAATYRPGTNSVERVLAGPAGRQVQVTDFMPWPGPGLDAPGGVVRLVRALAGPVEVEIEVMAGPNRRPDGPRRRVEPAPTGVVVDGMAVCAPAAFVAAPLDRDTPRWRAVARLEAGDELVVTAGLGHPLTPSGAHRLLEQTDTAWTSWLSRLAYSGPYLGAVERALLALRCLTGPGGAAAGAGTTSLPRRVGSERGRDDRWVSVTTTARAVAVLGACGLAEDAVAAEGWLRSALGTAHLPWPAWLDTDGQPVPAAEELPLAGWRRSQPVYAGRLPVPVMGLIGPVAAAVGASTSGPGGPPDDPGPLSGGLASLADGLDWSLDHWREPDGGPWEIAEPRRRHTWGRMWLLHGLERMISLARAANPLDLRAAAWQAERRPLLSWLEAEAAAGGRLGMHPGEEHPDAAVLAVAWAGPWPADHPIVAATVDSVLEQLSSGPFVYRYSDRVDDGRAGPDYPDLEASFSAVRALAALGRWDDAHHRMETLTAVVATAGAGLPAETVDPVTGQLYGNFPCAAAAVTVLEAALALERGPR